MESVVAIVLGVLALLTALVVLVTTIATGRRTVKLREEVGAVHLLVNSRLDATLAEMKHLRVELAAALARGAVLTEALEESDVAVPAAPVVEASGS